jgi:hypothetical protein
VWLGRSPVLVSPGFDGPVSDGPDFDGFGSDGLGFDGPGSDWEPTHSNNVC